jgi:hypothetical protein
MPIILSQNTTWSKGTTIVLTDDLQIAPGVTLTIEPGFTLFGNNKLITVYGALTAAGSTNNYAVLNNVDIKFGPVDNALTKIQLDFVQWNTGSLSGNSGAYGGKVKFDLTNSTFNNVYFGVAYPTESSSYVGNIFQNSNIGLMTSSGSVLIKNNLFIGSSQIYIGSNYNSGITVEKNSFLNVGKVSISLSELSPSDRSTALAIDNYYGTTDPTIINSMILDRSDSLTYAYYFSTSHTDKPDSKTPVQDATPPTITLTSDANEISIFQSANVVFKLSENSTNFTLSDIEVVGGTLTGFNGGGSTYSGIFKLSGNSLVKPTIRVSSGAFTDSSNNTNIDGAEADNTLTFIRKVITTNANHKLSVIVDKGVLSASANLLKGLSESITYTDGVITKHTVEYSGLTFDYNAIDSLITTVTRDDEFTTEFRKELTDFAPTSASLSYKDAALLIGLANIDTTLIFVAAADGNFIA